MPSYDPSGETLSLRTTTSGRVTSSAWDLTAPAWATSAQYAIVEGSEATDGDSYFAVSCVVPSGYTQNTVQNHVLQMDHSFVAVTPTGYYTLTADIIGGSITRLTGSAPAVFRAYCGWVEYDNTFGSLSISSPASSSNASSASTTVSTLPAGVVCYTGTLTVGTAYIKPYVVVEFGDVASIPAGTTIEFRFDNVRLMGPRGTATLNGATPGTRKVYALEDPSYVKNNDPYAEMSLVAPSIGTRIERPCYVEQIRYDVYPGNDKLKVTLGLSDAITGAYWTLDKSKLDVDTRLAI